MEMQGSYARLQSVPSVKNCSASRCELSLSPRHHGVFRIAGKKRAELGCRISQSSSSSPVCAAANVSTSDTSSTSLIPQTLKEMETDVEFQAAARNLREVGQEALTGLERRQRQRALHNLGLPNFAEFVKSQGGSDLKRVEMGTLQVNIGLYCNQACAHCHVESSPMRKEMMDLPTVDRLVDLLRASPSVHTVDITGGAPELNANFRHLVLESRKLGKKVIDRCNLTVLEEPGQEDLAEFLATNGVDVVASLPCYSQANVDVQRGRGVFERSIAALQKLNSIGYGQPGSGLVLDLVYNPVGASLPPPQASLETAYKKELWDNHEIVFNHLFTLTNIPIKRFADQLHRRGETEEYLKLLVSTFNLAAVSNVMCTNLISVRWSVIPTNHSPSQKDGTLFDCDFNQQLALPLPGVTPKNVWDLKSLEELVGKGISVDSHCFGCTAGQGSSCTGAVV